MKRMHIVVRDDLKTHGYKAAQGGHALAQYLIDHSPHSTDEWNNDYLIVLKIENEASMRVLLDRLEYHDVPHSAFKEPDIGNELTALAVLNNRKFFKNLDVL